MSDSNLVDITKTIGDKKQKASMRKLDAQASYICLEKCLQYLDINNMPELIQVKAEIKKTMQELLKIGK